MQAHPLMAKGQQRKNKEVKKPKKQPPPVAQLRVIHGPEGSVALINNHCPLLRLLFGLQQE